MSDGLPFVEELVPPPDALEACRRFAALPFVLFLDSATQDERLGRCSFLAADPPLVVRSAGDLDPLETVRRALAPWETDAVPGLPPFQGGAAGYLSYEWGAALERVVARHADRAIPAAILGIYDWVIAWDHAAGRAWILSTGIPDHGRARVERATRRLELVKRRLAPAAAAPRQAARSRPREPVPLRSNFTRDAYLDAVRRVIAYVCAGDIFQANLSQRFTAPLIGTALELYGRLRARNPAPFCAYLDYGDFVVASSSPERFLRVEDGRVEARPIKGTRPRGDEPREDAALAVALAESAKDRAENVMIVDLVRNDLSRVCRPGSVRAPELFTVEQYATVQHLVSTVVGDLEDGRDALDLVRAAFPCGSVTGAPKVRAMQIIAELEPSARGVYCGAIGYRSITGALDTSVAIRTCVVRGGEVSFHAGGGIVADSDPAEEYAETLDKARGIVAALVP